VRRERFGRPRSGERRREETVIRDSRETTKRPERGTASPPLPFAGGGRAGGRNDCSLVSLQTIRGIHLPGLTRPSRSAPFFPANLPRGVRNARDDSRKIIRFVGIVKEAARCAPRSEKTISRLPSAIRERLGRSGAREGCEVESAARGRRVYP